MNKNIILFKKRRALSPLITVVLLIIVSVIFTVMIMSWAKATTHKRLSDVEDNLHVASDLECSLNSFDIESCTIDYITKDVNLLISNSSNLKFSNLTLSLQGKNLDGNNMKLVGNFLPIINKGEVVYLSTANSSDFNYTLEDYSPDSFNVWDIDNFTLISGTCPNKPIDLKGCDVVDGEYGLVGHWSLAEKDTDGTTIDDLSDYNNNGTSANTPIFTTNQNGDVNSAMVFNGTDDYIDLGVDKPTDLTGDITISAWINPSGWGTYGRIIDNGKFVLYIDDSGTGGVNNNTIILTDVAGNYAYGSTNSILLNTWQHVLVTRTSVGITNIYINGILSGDVNQYSGTPVAGTTNTFIGNRDAKDRTFDGQISGLKIYNRALSENEVKSLYLAYTH